MKEKQNIVKEPFVFSLYSLYFFYVIELCSAMARTPESDFLPVLRSLFCSAQLG